MVLVPYVSSEASANLLHPVLTQYGVDVVYLIDLLWILVCTHLDLMTLYHLNHMCLIWLSYMAIATTPPCCLNALLHVGACSAPPTI